MASRKKKIESCLQAFPEETHSVLQSAIQQVGRLTADQCTQLTNSIGVSLDELAIRLLPLAKCFAVTPVSGFQVGAIALAGSKKKTEQVDLFFGSNLEFPYLPLNQCIHAEQSAALNAWQQNAERLYAIAVSESPCGYCRQFLNEFERSEELKIMRPAENSGKLAQRLLPELLPDAFGPHDLGRSTGLMAKVVAEHDLVIDAHANDRVLATAIEAARNSYTPYSNNPAGCSVETERGEIFSGRSVESAAYSPSLTPLQTAIIGLNLSSLSEDVPIRRVVLVEKCSFVSQRKSVQMFLEAWAPGIEMEYYEAE